MDVDQETYEAAKEHALALLPQAGLTPAEFRILLDACTEELPHHPMVQVLRLQWPGATVKGINWVKAANLLELRRTAREAGQAGDATDLGQQPTAG